MAHEAQDRYSKLVDIKLRNTLVTKDGAIFNARYEGSPKAGKVKIPVRDTEVSVREYDKATGVSLETGSTTYLDMDIDHDEAVNELIDGFDAAAVPDGITAERLDSAGYSLALSIDKASIGVLEACGTMASGGATVSSNTAALTTANAYAEVLAAKRALSRLGVPAEGRFLLVSPEFLEVLMQDDTFVKQGDLSQQLMQNGASGKIAGFAVYETNNMDYESTTRVSGKTVTTDFIAGHPNWCHRVMEWSKDVHLQNLDGSGTYIGACAVQGRKIYGIKVSKPQTLYIKRTEV